MLKIMTQAQSTKAYPQMHEITSYNFKIFRESIPPEPPRLACPASGESGLALIYAACYTVLNAVKISAKSSDQISGRHRSETTPWWLH